MSEVVDLYEQRLLNQAIRRKHQCVFCKQQMKIDDIDYSFEGCQDEYWCCPYCKSSLFVKVRYHKLISKHFEKGEDYGKGEKKKIDSGNH